MKHWVSAAVLAASATGAAAQETPFRLGEALNLPDNLTLTGAYRVRYEAQDGRFRAGFTGSDQILVQRLLLGAEYDFGGLYVGAELQDSRQQIADTGTPIGTDDVNTAELLRAYIGYRRDGVFQSGDTLDLTAGRITIDAGSRRLSARNRFRNTVNGFTGVHGRWTGADGTSVQAFFTLPVTREPSEAARLLDNDVAFDDEDVDQRFWAVHVTRPDLWRGLTGEVYLFGLQEKDDGDSQTLDRDLFTPGFRFFRSPEAGAFDFEIETAFQIGESSLSSAPNAPLLDHFAHFHHAHLAYTFDNAWRTRLVVQYDFASGDNDPGDDENGRFDTLFGARRFEFGPTGVFGALARSNLNSPGVRVEARPGSRWQGFVGYRAALLAAKRDVFTTAGVQDPTGAAGREIGHQFETRIRYDLLPGNIRLETGAAYLIDGDFLQDAPNAPGEGDVFYGYGQVTFSF